MNYLHRYDKNSVITSEMQHELYNKSVAVIGLGGLGGFAVEALARFGVGHILGFDFDTFSETNLNRQLFCTEKSLGSLKSEQASCRVHEINSDILFSAVSDRLDKSGLKDALQGCDAVLDCLDTLHDRIVLEGICSELNIPMVHGAIGGWFGQVSTILPGDSTLEKLYPCADEPENAAGNTVFAAAAVASFQVSETVKLLTGEGSLLNGSVLMLDFYSNEFQIINL